jgi:hypothetical protein
MPAKNPAAYVRDWRKRNPEKWKAQNNASQRRYRERHKERLKEYRARPEVREKRREQWRRWACNYRYGITHEDRDALLARQGGCCAICKSTEPPSRGWHIDHDHATGEVRGILCNKCNTGLGLFKENVKTFHAAIDYLGKLTAP